MKWFSEVDWVCTDTETTGLRPGIDHVVEVAAARCIGSQVVSLESRIIRLPDEVLDAPEYAEAQAIHGITPTMVLDLGVPPAEVRAWLIAMVEGAQVVAGHHVDYDIGMLGPRGYPWPPHVLCTQALAWGTQRYDGMSLEKVALAYGVKPGTAHRAAGDVDTTVRLLPRLLAAHRFSDLAVAVSRCIGWRKEVREWFAAKDRKKTADSAGDVRPIRTEARTSAVHARPAAVGQAGHYRRLRVKCSKCAHAFVVRVREKAEPVVPAARAPAPRAPAKPTPASK